MHDLNLQTNILLQRLSCEATAIRAGQSNLYIFNNITYFRVNNNWFYILAIYVLEGLLA